MTNDLNIKKRTLISIAGLVAVSASFGVASLLAPAVFGQNSAQNHAPDTGGPVTERVVVASGTAGEFGKWELVASEDAAGEPCLGVRLLEPAEGMPSLAEGCGPATDDQVGNISGSRGTLFFGRVADNAEVATVSSRGVQERSLKAFGGRDGRTYVLAAADAGLSNAIVTVSDGSGNNLGRVDPASK